MATPDEGDLAPTIHYYIYKLTGRDTDELLELAQDRDVWRELVVEWWSDLHPHDWTEKTKIVTVIDKIIPDDTLS